MFDKLYAVTKGQCIYQGPVKELIPFLGNMGLHCPSYHNPADFCKLFFFIPVYLVNKIIIYKIRKT